MLVSNSAMGKANHTPSIPMKGGKRIKIRIIKTKPLERDIKRDALAYSFDCLNDVRVILSPIKMKPRKYNLMPLTVIFNNSRSGLTKTDTKNPGKKNPIK